MSASAVTTAHDWDRPVRSIVRTRRPVEGPVATTPVTYLTSHRTADCPVAASGRVVAEGVDFASPDAGLPCDTCTRSTFVPAPVAPAAPTVALPAGLEILPRPNKYAGSCALCGGRVAEGAGRLARHTGRWAVVHADGQCQGVSAPTTATAPVTAPTASPATSLPDVPAGHYAIVSQGSNDLMFVRVDRPAEGRYAGRTFLKMIVGGHPDQNLAYARTPGILARIVAEGIAESAARYGQELGRCCRCNRTLTDETSRALGIGPECRSRVS